MSYYDQVKEASEAVRARVAEVPSIAVVLGSGLGDFAGSLGDAVSMSYGGLPHWPASAVVGHEGRLVVGKVRGRTIAALSGRCHVYEGHDLKTVTFAVRALGLLGVRTLVLMPLKNLRPALLVAGVRFQLLLAARVNPSSHYTNGTETESRTGSGKSRF